MRKPTQPLLFDVPEKPDKRLSQRPPRYLVPPHSPPKRCRSCQKTVYWGVTENGKPVLLEPPDKDGLGLNHFVTCKDAKHWRKR